MRVPCVFAVDGAVFTFIVRGVLFVVRYNLCVEASFLCVFVFL